MKRRHIILVLGAGALMVWLLTSAWQQRVAVSSPPPPAPTAVPAPPEAKPVVTNLPGIGPIPTDPTELARLKAKLKAELDAAFKGTAFFTSREESRQADETGEIAWILINAHKSMEMAMEHITKSATEPFPPRILEALHHILSNATDPQMKLIAATLLYRYDQQAGKAYLLSVLNSPNVDLLTRHVALCLAMNLETAAIPGIVANLPKMGRPSTPLLATLGKWHVSEIDRVLQHQARLNPESWGYALALVQGGDGSAVGPLERRLTKETTPDGDLVFNLEAVLAAHGRPLIAA